MNDAKYIGLDVHQATISAAVLDSADKLVMECILETKAATILQFIHGLRRSLHVTLGIHSAIRLHVLRAPSLSTNPMPRRTTRKSDRPRASDRTMLGTAQPLYLPASGTERRRYESIMNLRGRKTHSVSLHSWG
jgi:hypothetical protein